MSKSQLNPVPLTWLMLVATLISCVFVMNAWVTHNLGAGDSSFDWFFETATVATNYFLWAVIIPLVHRFIVTNPMMWQATVKVWLVHLAVSVLIAVLHRYMALGLYVLVNGLYKGFFLDLFGVHSLAWVIRGTIPSWIQYWLIIAMLWGIHYYQLKRVQEMVLIKKEQELTSAHLNALKMQLHPHFFFNTLNTIASVMQKNVESAQSLIAKLAKLMRSLVDSEHQQFITLKEEMAYIQDYLDIECARFSDQLHCVVTVESGCETALVPNLLLQPLVENAIKHGLRHLSSNKKVAIAVSADQSQLQIDVSDNGVGVANVAYVVANPGVGLKSVIERLEHLYAGAASYAITSEHNQGFAIKLLLPFQKEVGE